MDKIIKQLYDEIPEFDKKDAASILKNNCNKMFEHILMVKSTTINETEEKNYDSFIPILGHTLHKEVRMAYECYEQWKKSKSDSDWDDYETLFKSAYKHIGVDIATLLF